MTSDVTVGTEFWHIISFPSLSPLFSNRRFLPGVGLAIKHFNISGCYPESVDTQ